MIETLDFGLKDKVAIVAGGGAVGKASRFVKEIFCAAVHLHPPLAVGGAQAAVHSAAAAVPAAAAAACSTAVVKVVRTDVKNYQSHYCSPCLLRRPNQRKILLRYPVETLRHIRREKAHLASKQRRLHHSLQIG